MSVYRWSNIINQDEMCQFRGGAKPVAGAEMLERERYNVKISRNIRYPQKLWITLWMNHKIWSEMEL